MASTNFENEVKSWLTVVLKSENFEDIFVQILGNSEKGDGYMGDIVFVKTTAIRKTGSKEEYNFVLKCSKRGEALKKDERFKDAFINEIFVYNKVLPSLIQFQKEKEIEEIFDKVSKCYGTLSREDTQVIVLENLKQSGYELWPRKQPLTKYHIELVLQAYARFHATSAAMEIEQPDEFQRIKTTLENNLKSFFNPNSNMNSVFKECIEYAADVLKNDLNSNVLSKWRNLGTKVDSIFGNLRNFRGFKTLLHGDCWSNNFMFKYKSDDKKPSDVVIIDWQVARCSTPVHDLTYFLFTGISKEDIDSIDDFLNLYYKSFTAHLTKLGVSDPSGIFSFDQLQNDWNSHAICGIILASMLIKVCLAEKTDIVDASEMAEKGQTFGSNFVEGVKDTEAFKNRMKHIIEFADKKGFL